VQRAGSSAAAHEEIQPRPQPIRRALPTKRMWPSVRPSFQKKPMCPKGKKALP
jgi:hypothetical protein